MGEFDLDFQHGGGSFGWEAVFRPQQAPGGRPGMRNADASDDCVYACDPSFAAEAPTCYYYTDCGTCSLTCGGVTGRPCAC
jgi:hypothetical protein